MKAIERRLARLESPGASAELLLVPQYSGMTRAEAMSLRFGAAGPLADADLVFIINALPPETDRRPIDYNWAAERGTPKYAAIRARLAGLS